MAQGTLTARVKTRSIPRTFRGGRHQAPQWRVPWGSVRFRWPNPNPQPSPLNPNPNPNPSPSPRPNPNPNPNPNPKGTDTAGSGRIPAALNNLIGLKPTIGRISCRGLLPACKSLDCPSIFALTAQDAAKVLGVMEGLDMEDEYSRKVPSTLPAWNADTFVFGVPNSDQLCFFGNEDGPRLFEEACRLLEQLGGTRIEVDYRPFKEAADLLYEGPWVAERLAVIQDFMEKNPDAVLETTRNITNKGHQFSAVDVFKSMYRLEAIRKQVAPLWDTMQFLVTPTAGQVYPIAEMQADPVQLNTNLGRYMNFMNLLDMTAVAVPTGFLPSSPVQMPFGITVSRPAFFYHDVLKLASRLQTISGLRVSTTTAEAPFGI
jgi:allophanate hydrolase